MKTEQVVICFIKHCQICQYENGIKFIYTSAAMGNLTAVIKKNIQGEKKTEAIKKHNAKQRKPKTEMLANPLITAGTT